MIVVSGLGGIQRPGGLNLLSQCRMCGPYDPCSCCMAGAGAASDPGARRGPQLVLICWWCDGERRERERERPSSKAPMNNGGA